MPSSQTLAPRPRRGGCPTRLRLAPSPTHATLPPDSLSARTPRCTAGHRGAPVISHPNSQVVSVFFQNGPGARD